MGTFFFLSWVSLGLTFISRWTLSPILRLRKMLGAVALGRPRGMVWGGRREEGSGWGARVCLWRIHFDIWQNQYNTVKFKNKIKLKKKKKERKSCQPPLVHLPSRAANQMPHRQLRAMIVRGRSCSQHSTSPFSKGQPDVALKKINEWKGFFAEGSLAAKLLFANCKIEVYKSKPGNPGF